MMTTVHAAFPEAERVSLTKALRHRRHPAEPFYDKTGPEMLTTF